MSDGLSEWFDGAHEVPSVSRRWSLVRARSTDGSERSSIITVTKGRCKMCRWGNSTNVRLKFRQEVTGKMECAVDRCIAPVVQWLNDCGVQTLGSCCGHGNEDATIIIVIDRRQLTLTIKKDEWERYKRVPLGRYW